MSKIEVNTVAPQCGTTLTLGENNDTVVLGTGAAFGGGVGAVKWETTPQTGSFQATAGRGYFMNTTSGALTVTLPAGSAGAIVSFADYAGTWQTNNLTVSPQSGEKIGGVSVDVALNTEGQSVTFVYVDSTQGWINVQDSTSNERGNPFIVATGGTITCCGDYKIHTFTGPGTFTVTNGGAAPGSNTVDYLIVAGGGGGGQRSGGPSGVRGGGGGGAGGARMSSGTASGCYTASPLGACVSALPVTAQGYSITVGGGGTGATTDCTSGGQGSNSIFSSITSAGGGGGGYGGCFTVINGGSGGGGGGGGTPTGGTGNTPPVSPPQGNNGSPGFASGPDNIGGGGAGGGAGAAGGCGSVPGAIGGAGGNGIANSITGSSVTRAGGGGSGVTKQGPAPINIQGGPGGSGGGGAGSGAGTPSPTIQPSVAGTTNTGGGGGGAGNLSGGADGGSGIVIIRYKFQ